MADIVIPFQNVRLSHDAILKDYMSRMQKLFEAQSPDFIGSNSPTVGAFECDMAGYLGCKHAFGVASGTDALILPLHALGIGAGDEVIMPAYSFIATADVVVRLGARPVFVDIDLATFNIDGTKLEAAVTPRTKAIIPVHLFGQSADMTAVMAVAKKHKIPVIEDVAQGTGAKWDDKRVGTIGDFGAYSFYPTKNLGGCGDGGLITTDNDEYAYIIKLFRDHGRGKGGFESIGYNSRLDAVQALYLHLKLPDLDDSLYERVENARLYNQLLEGAGAHLPAIPEGDLVHSFNLYTIRVHDRTRLRAYLSEKGVGTAVYYDTVMPLTPALSFLGHKPGEFPASEEAASTVVSLPVWPGMTKRHIEHVAGAVRDFLRNNVAMPAEK